MPNIVSYTPAWLQKPNPGYDVFTTSQPKGKSTHASYSNGSSTISKRGLKPGARRTIARRGTEIFIAVGKEIRWVDLVYLKDGWQEKQEEKGMGRDSNNSQYPGEFAQSYRVRNVDLFRGGKANYSRPLKHLLQKIFDS
jgi:nucleoporin NUP82